jgi:N-sulfoglucosamine sulfohydrolase
MKKRSLLSVLPLPARFLLAYTMLLPAARVRAMETVTADRPNFLIIVADDMNYDSPGFAGGVAPDVTPNLDRLVKESMLFTKAHVTVSVCQPSRQSMLSGTYPHRYGGVGFFPMADNTPTVSAQLGKAGYLTAALNKLWHTLPTEAFAWDLEGDRMNLGIVGEGMGRVPDALRRGVSAAIRTSDEQGKPFFIMVNSDDPHRPFHGSAGELGTFGEEKMRIIATPSRVYGPDEVTVPRSMPDLPGIRRDLAKYASSVRRLDDTVGACLGVLRETGKEQDTVVIFLSDNGIPLLFGKFETYLESTLTPLVVRWPGHIQAGRVDDRHLVSMVDITPTVLELAGAPQIPDVDGRSLVPLMMGDQDVPWRDYVVTLRYEEIYYGIFIRQNLEHDPTFVDTLKAQGWVERPDHEAKGTMSRSMNKRCVNDGRFGYIYNHWFDGSPKQAYPYGDPGLEAMRLASVERPRIARRVEFYTYRSKEELYDWEADSGSWTNLVDEPDHQQRLQTLRQNLLRWMDETEDPIREDFRSYLSSLDHGS